MVIIREWFLVNWTSKVKGMEEFWTLMDKGWVGGGLKNWTISMDVICVSSVGVIQNEFKMYFYIDVESYNRISINSLIKIFRTTAR